MDPQLISKILKFSSDPAGATFIGDHPLLDPASCRALASGLVRLLHVSSTARAPRARNALLGNIRALTAHTHSHHQSTQHLIQILTEHYYRLASKKHEHSCEDRLQDLSLFLASQLQDMKLENNVDSTTICLARALLNVNPDNAYLERITKQLLRYDSKAVQNFLQEVWLRNIFTDGDLVNQLTLKARPEIERILLDAAHNIVTVPSECNLEVLDSKPMKNILDKSSKSGVCFQLCCDILNRCFIISNFDIKLQTFIQTFVENVRSIANDNFIRLYCDEVQSVAMILSCDGLLGEENELVETVIIMLNELKIRSKEKFIMLLSHHSNWLDFCIERNILV